MAVSGKLYSMLTGSSISKVNRCARSLGRGFLEISRDHLERLTKAPLKPQQRIFALKVGALPKVYYHIALGRINISDIRKADKMACAFVR